MQATTTIVNAEKQVAEWITANLRSRAKKRNINAFALLICETANGHIDGWDFSIHWETSLLNCESQIRMEL